ncbi:MAG: NUMOD1 domain-containing DNA-binding protein [Bacteroidia bacterium]
MKGRKPSEKTITGSIKSLQTAIIQYDLDNNFIKEWESIKEAETILKLKTIGSCCKNKQKRSGNFIFKYKFPDKVRKLLKKKNIKFKNNFSKPIFQYDKNNNFISEWISGKKASQELKLNPSDISAVCNKRQKTAGGYIFKFEKTI